MEAASLGVCFADCPPGAALPLPVAPSFGGGLACKLRGSGGDFTTPPDEAWASEADIAPVNRVN